MTIIQIISTLIVLAGAFGVINYLFLKAMVEGGKSGPGIVKNYDPTAGRRRTRRKQRKQRK